MVANKKIDIDININMEIHFGERIGHRGWLIGPKLFRPEAYPTRVSFKLCEFILHQVPSYSPASIAEYAIAQIMALAKNTHMSYVMTKKANFEVTSMQAIAVKSSKQGNCL